MHPWYSKNISELGPQALIFCYCMLISNKKEGPITGSKVCCSAMQWSFQNRLHAAYSNNILKLRTLALSFCHFMKVQSLTQKFVGRLSNGPLKIEGIPHTATISQVWGDWLSYSFTVCWFLTKKQVHLWLKWFLIGNQMGLWKMNRYLIQQPYHKVQYTGLLILWLYADF